MTIINPEPMVRQIPLLAVLLSPAAAIAAEWSHYGADLGGTRFAAATQITPDNVGNLELAWQFRSGDAADGEDYFGRDTSLKATPILFDGKLLVSTGFNRVFAISAATGRRHWVFDPEVDFTVNYSEMFTSRGVAAWRDAAAERDEICRGRVYLGTLDARLIAIDAHSGEKCVGFGRSGEVDLSAGVRNYRRGQYSLTSPVTVVNDVVIVGSSIGDNGAVELEPGFVRGFDARSGELLWQWDPIPRSEDSPGGNTWSNNGGEKNGGANVWSIISADPARNLVFLPTTSPSPDFYGGERLGDNRFANSVVAVNAGTGELAWHFQTVHHDLWDYDIASQPLLMDIHREGARVPVVVQATKMGHVFVLDRETGRPVFPVEERAVPQTDVPGESTAATQPFPVRPPPLHDRELRIWNYSAEHTEFCTKLLDGVRFEGIFTPPSLGGTLLYPGNGGGTNWGSMAADPDRQIAVLAVNSLPTLVRLVPRKDFRATARRERGGDLNVQFTEQSGTPYGMARHELYNPNLFLPCLEGPWGEVVALDMKDGSVRWKSPLGVFPGLEDHPVASRWGSLASGGPMVTAAGLLFIADRYRKRLLAMDSETGETIWSTSLPAAATATPMSYTIDGEQYVVIAAGGDVNDSDVPGDYVLAWKLRE